MTVKNVVFKTSVNIKFDLGKKEFVNRYLPTPSHAESLLGLLKGFTGKELKSNIIIGPYGTGKSLVATIVGGLVSKQIDKRTFNALAKKFDKVHQEIYEELHQINELDMKYLTVALNGNEGRFRYAVLSAINKTITENKIDITLPGQNGKIIQTIDLWEVEFPKTFKAFKKILKEHEKDLGVFRLNILNQDKEEIEWFINVYPLLTSGAEFVVDYQDSFIDQVAFVLKELKKQNIGLFIAYDEFGRMMQTIEPRFIHETMQDLQDLAELTNNTAENLHLLLITHRNLAQYLGLFNEEFKNEFQRIEKRFRTYYIESDSSTFIRIADSYLSELQEEIGKKHISNSLIDELRKYPLFPELNQQEVEKLVLEGTYPIHPVALYLLPLLSSFFGQNERTLFTFLESNETGGLNNHLESKEGYYLPSDLFHYFFPSIHDIDTSSEEFNALKLYKSLITKIPAVLEDSNKVDVLRFITLWELVGAQSRFKLTTDFIQFALDMTQSEITRCLAELSALKAIRFNRVRGYWELLEGSAFFIEEMIEDRRTLVNINKQKKEEVLKGLLPKRYFLANEYNDEKSMTRYAEIDFLFSSDIVKDDFDVSALKKKKHADAVVFYVILESHQELKKVEEVLRSVDDNYSIFCISKYSFATIEEEVNQLVVLDEMLADLELLKEDKNLKLELNLKKEDLLFTAMDYINKFTSYNGDCTWYYQKEQSQITSEVYLEDLISTIMFVNYPLTPEVRNDSFNRRKLNNMQRNAGYSVLDQILNHYHETNMGIEGQGPDYLIYATIFKNNHLDITKLDNIESLEFRELRNRLSACIEENPEGNLADLFAILEKEPFGIRKPLIPIFITALLRDKWDQLTFYRNDMYIAGITGEKLYKMFEEPEEFQYVYYKFEEAFEEFFVTLEVQFSSYENELIKNKPRFIRLNNAMLSWLRSLPRITQTTSLLADQLLDLKDTIKRSEVNPQETIMALYNKYNQDVSELFKDKLEIESFYSNFKEELQKQILQITKQDNLWDLLKLAQDKDAETKKKNKLIKNLLNIQAEDDWIEPFANAYVGIELTNWSDVTNEMFLNQIKNDYSNSNVVKHNTGNNIEIHYNGTMKSISKVELSTKSETIYLNIQRMIKQAGRNVPKEEVEYLIYSLLDEFIE